MALKLLQPGMQPAGQFDLKDGTTLHGGEYVELSTAGTDYAASDVSAVGPSTYMEPGIRSLPGAVKFGGLADEGTTGYGTSFGTIIGATVGQGTGFGSLSTTGVVVVGPQSSTGSGKVTVWHAPGLYGVSGVAATGATVAAALSTLAVNVIVEAETATGYLGAAGVGGGATVGVTVGAVKDTSLVSTTATAAGETAETEFYAIYMTAING